MDYFVLSSKKYIKEWIPDLHLISLTDKDIVNCLEMSGFLFFILKNYFKFLLWRLKLAFNLIPEIPTLNRQFSCVNKVYNHILLIEWGFYDHNVFEGENSFNSFYSTLAGLNPDFFRPEGTVEYPFNYFDLKYPIHKLSNARYLFSRLYKDKPPFIPKTFFFNFYLFIPFKTTMFNFPASGTHFQSNLKTPFEIDFPILFELLLLKFTIFSIFLSFSKHNLYEFYSLGLLESLFIRFRSILDKILISLFKLFWKSKTFNSFDSGALNNFFKYIGNLLFYSKTLFSSEFSAFVFSVFKTYFLKDFEDFKILKLPLKFCFCLILVFEFFLIWGLISSLQFDISSILIFFDLRSFIRSIFFKYLFHFILLSLIFFFSIRLIEMLIQYFLPFSSYFYTVYGLRLRAAILLNKIWCAITESILKNFFGIVSLLLIFNYFINFGGSLVFQNFVCALSVYYFIKFLSSLINTIALAFKYSLVKLGVCSKKIFIIPVPDSVEDFLDKVSNNVYFLILLPFSFTGYLFFSFITTAVLLFCYFLRVFYTPLIERDPDVLGYVRAEDYVNSYFRVPFLTFSEEKFRDTFDRADQSANQLIFMESALAAGFSQEFLYAFSEKYSLVNLNRGLDIYKLSPHYHSNYFQKFLCDRNNKLFIIEYIDFDFVNQHYSSRSVTYLPNKLIYSALIIVTFIWWFFLNFFVIVYFLFPRLYYFFVFLVRGDVNTGSFKRRRWLLFWNHSFFKKECMKEYFYYFYWLDSNMFFPYNANPYNKKMYGRTFRPNFISF